MSVEISEASQERAHPMNLRQDKCKVIFGGVITNLILFSTYLHCYVVMPPMCFP